MGWDGMGLSGEPHGPIFSSHPIPLGALFHSVQFFRKFHVGTTSWYGIRLAKLKYLYSGNIGYRRVSDWF